MRFFISTFVILIFSLFAARTAVAKEPDFITLGAGVYDLFDDETTGEYRVEYIFSEDQKIKLFTPFVGLTGTAEGGTYGYAGVGVDLFFGSKVVLTPNFAAGIYGNGDGKDLGYAVEFRSGANFMFRLEDNSRIGISFHHISNAGLNSRNPGEESLLFIYSVPFNGLFSR
jgi:lipid A 3-O-deacylase